MTRHHSPHPSTATPADRSDPEAAARQLILRQLARAPRARAQLARALTRRGVSQETVERVLDRFTDVGLIDDAAFAQAWVDSRHAGRGLARRALAYELRARGIEGETAANALAHLNPAEEENTARDLVRRRLRATAGEQPQARIRRVAGTLARKGYPAALALRLIREELETEDGVVAADSNDEGLVDGA